HGGSDGNRSGYRGGGGRSPGVSAARPPRSVRRRGRGRRRGYEGRVLDRRVGGGVLRERGRERGGHRADARGEDGGAGGEAAGARGAPAVGPPRGGRGRGGDEDGIPFLLVGGVGLILEAGRCFVFSVPYSQGLHGHRRVSFVVLSRLFFESKQASGLREVRKPPSWFGAGGGVISNSGGDPPAGLVGSTCCSGSFVAYARRK
ncbi:unnamed protein product, partial [Scytosiphon promiscuus]